MLELRNMLAPEVRAHAPSLAEVLIDCVEGGASVSFMAGISKIQAEQFFEIVAAAVEKRERFLIAAFLDDALVGTVQLVTGMPDNQPHRAEIAKLLVARSARGRGVGAALMRHAEEMSRRAGKTLLVLDTATGGDAERLYCRLGWTKAGIVPNYALLPDGSPCATTIFWKALSNTQPRSFDLL
jgi:ribosomal protein S18 acetylase RimI-like enzyme